MISNRINWKQDTFSSAVWSAVVGAVPTGCTVLNGSTGLNLIDHVVHDTESPLLCFRTNANRNQLNTRTIGLTRCTLKQNEAAANLLQWKIRYLAEEVFV